MVKHRIQWIDYARAVAMLMVIVNHSLISKLNTPLGWTICAVHVPLFFIMSGYLLKPRRWRVVFRKSNVNLLLPYVGTVILIWLIEFLHPISHGIINVHNPNSSLLAAIYGIGVPAQFMLNSHVIYIPFIGAIWFLLAMYIGDFIWNMTLIISEKHGTWVPLLLSAVYTIIGFLISSKLILPWSFNAALISQSFYFWGYLLRKYHLVDNINWLIFVGGVICWAWSASYGIFHFVSGQSKNPLVAILGACGGGYVISCLLKLADDHLPSCQALATFGRLSLIVLCFHLLDLNSIGIAGYLLSLPLPSFWLNISLAFAWHLLFAIVMLIVIPKIPLLRSIYLYREYPLHLRLKSKTS